MKKRIALLLALCMTAALCACGGGKAREEETVLKIGVYEPQSGAYAAAGKQEILGIQYANYVTPTVVIGGKTCRVELVISDNASSVEEADAAASALVSEGCSVVLGSYGSDVSLAASATFSGAGIAAVGISCTDPQITLGNDHYFRICALDPFQGNVLAGLAKKTLGARTAYCLGRYGRDDDRSLIDAFRQAAEGLGISVVTAEFPENTVDFTAYLNAAADEGADVIVAPGEARYALPILEQLAALADAQDDAQALLPALLACDVWDSAAVLSAAADKEIRLYVCAPYAEGADPGFDQGMKEWINASSDALANNGGSDAISSVSAMAYDSYHLVLEAAKKAGSVEKEDILAILPAVAYKGVCGAVSFGASGDAIRDGECIRQADTKEGVWSFVTVAKAA